MGDPFRAVSEIAETIRVCSENTGRMLRAFLVCLVFAVMIVGTVAGVMYSIAVIGPK